MRHLKVTRNIVAHHLDYRPDTGTLIWRVRDPSMRGARMFNTVWGAKVAGCQGRRMREPEEREGDQAGRRDGIELRGAGARGYRVAVVRIGRGERSVERSS